MELIAGLVRLDHRQFREDAAAIELLLLLLLQQQRSHQADDRGVVGEDADDAGAAFDLLVEALQRVGASDLAPVLRWEHPEGQDALPGLLHQG